MTRQYNMTSSLHEHAYHDDCTEIQGECRFVTESVAIVEEASCIGIWTPGYIHVLILCYIWTCYSECQVGLAAAKRYGKSMYVCGGA